MTKPLLAILLLLPLSVSAGELDGKSLICSDDIEDEIEQGDLDEGDIGWSGWRFDGTTVITDSVGRRDTTAVITTEEIAEYWVTPNSVEWGPPLVGGTTLDRKSLTMTTYLGNHPGPLYLKAKCEVVPSRDVYYQKLESLRLDFQRQMDEEMKDNKI